MTDPGPDAEFEELLDEPPLALQVRGDQPCQTFWGSHGCALPRFHADAAVRHQCGELPSETNPDGLCSVVERAADGSWLLRFSTLDPAEVDGTAFPVKLYGPDFDGLGDGVAP